MRRDGLPLVIVLAGVTVFLFAGSFLFAQTPPSAQPGETALPGQVEDKEKITYEFRETPIADVLKYIADRVGRTIVLEQGIEDRISVNFKDLHYLEAIEQAADSARCVTRVVGNRIIVEKPPRVTMEFKQAELVEVINLLAKQAGANIVIDQAVKGTVTMRFSDVPWMKALSAVVKTAGYTLVEEDRGNIIRVVDPSKLQAQMETRVFKFKFIKPDEYYKAKIDTTRHVGTTPTPQDPVKGFTLLDTLRNMLTRPPGAPAGAGAALKTLGRLDYYKEGNCIIVVDTKPVLDQMEEIIRQLDVEPEQVLTDVIFVTTSNEDFIEIGTNWSTPTGVEGFTISTRPNDQNGTQEGQSTTRFPFNLGPTTNAGASTPTSDLHTAFFNTYDMTATLRLFARDADTEFIQRPNIATRTHMEATIFVGEEIHYAETEATTAQSGQLQITIREATKSPVTVGFQLFLIPHVVVGTNQILMTVIPQDESLTGTTSPAVPGFNRFQAQSGGTTATIDLPSKRQATIVTHMLLESGQTMVVGGLQQDRTRHTVRKVPYVGDIPLFGWLFKRREDQIRRDHLFVFITPRIVRGMKDEGDQLTRRDAARRIDMEEAFKLMQGVGDEEALRRAIEERSAANEKAFEALEAGPTPGK